MGLACGPRQQVQKTNGLMLLGFGIKYEHWMAPPAAQCEGSE
jgi:hypothetical protein